jgi:hypothetical protein
MFASTTRAIPAAASAVEMPIGRAILSPMALLAASASRASRPPAKKSGASRASTRSASVTVGSVPPFA